MRFKLKLRELSDMDVKFVSMVERGANRIPFRLLKSEQENQMLDLSNIRRSFKKAEVVAPSVQAVILSKGDAPLIEEVKMLLKIDGIDLPNHKVFEEDGTVVLFKDEDYATSTPIRVGENFAVISKGFVPFATGTASFDAVKDTGFYDSVSSAASSLSDTVAEAMNSAKTQAEVKLVIKSSLEKFGTYANALVDGLPLAVFKIESEVDALIEDFSVTEGIRVQAEADALENVAAAATTVEKAEVAPSALPTPAVTEVAVAKMHGDGDVKDKEMSAEELAAYDAAEVAKAEEVAKKVKKEEQNDAILADIAKSVSALASQMAALSSSVAGVQAVQKESQEKLAEAVRKADTATRVVQRSVVAINDAGGDPVVAEPVKKSDGDLRTGIFDSAMLRKTR